MSGGLSLILSGLDPHAAGESGRMLVLTSPGSDPGAHFFVAQVLWRSSYLLPTKEKTEKISDFTLSFLQLNKKDESSKARNKQTKPHKQTLSKQPFHKAMQMTDKLIKNAQHH